MTRAIIHRLGKRIRRKYYYFDVDSRLRAVRRFPFRFAGGGTLFVVLCLAALLVANHLTGDSLGLGYIRAQRLTVENQSLQQRLEAVNGRVKELEGSVAALTEQGNRLRLMVDLPTLDKATASGGTGGAVERPDEVTVPAGGADPLRSASDAIRGLEGRLKVQEQSYGEILRKYDYNKGYFAAIPALKPMEGFYSVGEYGLRMHPVLGIFKTHEGLDIVNDVGTPVVAAGDGVVQMAGQSGGGYGIAVVIRHGYGYQTLYAHLSKVLVRSGEHVVRGQIIAKSGKSGLVSGPHLHYEVRCNGVCKNPADYFFDDVKPLDYRSRVASR
jgi:murein DD-endopeptidase MepM/ murein hydrolase activator NlpD